MGKFFEPLRAQARSMTTLGKFTLFPLMAMVCGFIVAFFFSVVIPVAWLFDRITRTRAFVWLDKKLCSLLFVK